MLDRAKIEEAIRRMKVLNNKTVLSNDEIVEMEKVSKVVFDLAEKVLAGEFVRREDLPSATDIVLLISEHHSGNSEEAYKIAKAIKSKLEEIQ